MRKIIFLFMTFLVLILISLNLPYGFWAEINELPAHPLIVHSVVVLVPISAILILIAMLKPRFLDKYKLFILILIGVLTINTQAAKSSGDSLSAAVGLPEDHAAWGNRLVTVMIVLFILFGTFLLVKNFITKNFLSNFLKILIAIIAIISVIFTYLAGHSGAESAWKAKYDAARPLPAGEVPTVSRAEVSLHNSASDCWTIVSGFVYDVTSFVNRHPAGSEAILEMCGTDASEDFFDEHLNQAEPEKWLESLKIGTVE